MILEALIEYRLYLCVRRVGGGEVRLRGLCPCCKIHRGDYVHVVKFMGGGLCPCCKIHGGIISTYTNFSRGGGLSGGILSYTKPLRSQTF